MVYPGFVASPMIILAIGGAIVRAFVLGRESSGSGLFDHPTQAVEVALVLLLVVFSGELEGLLGLRERLVVEAVGEERPGEGVADHGILGPEFGRRASEAQATSHIGLPVPAAGSDAGTGTRVEVPGRRVAS